MGRDLTGLRIGFPDELTDILAIIEWDECVRIF